MAMEMLEGQSLDKVLAAGPLAVETCVEIVDSVLEALAFTDHAGIVHRDIKPANIVVRRDIKNQLRITLIDFGIAKALEGGIPIVTAPGLLLGTPQYMSPEQITGHAIDGRADLYAVGALLFETLTGVSPFQGSDFHKVVSGAITTSPPDVRALRPDCPNSLAHFVRRALAKAPENRFQDAQQMRGELARCEVSPRPRLPERLDEADSLAPEAPPPRSGLLRRHGWQLAMLAGLGLAAAAHLDLSHDHLPQRLTEALMSSLSALQQWSAGI